MTAVFREYNYPDVRYVCERLPRAEQLVIEALDGEAYDAEAVAKATTRYPGMHYGIMAPDSEPIVAGGLIRMRRGVFRTWFYATDRAWREFGKDVTEKTRYVIRNTINSDLAHRIETLTLASRERARTWYGMVGLEYESTLRGYGVNGEDAVMYVALRNPENV